MSTTLRDPWAVEPPLHRPRLCPSCRHASTAIVDDRCLLCREPGTLCVKPDHGRCEHCRQRLLLGDRTVCARCVRVEAGSA